MPQFYVLSQRKLRNDPAVGCLIECEDVLVNACAATLLLPDWQQPIRPSWSHRILHPYQVSVPPQNPKEEQILILTGMDWKICDTLQAIPNWRSRFDLVCAYIFDPYFTQKVARHRISSFYRRIASLDHLFIPISTCVQDYQQNLATQVSFLPVGCNVLKFGSQNLDRSIDVIGYGRQHLQHSQILAQTYNVPESKRMYYFTQHMGISQVYDFHAYRTWFWKILQRSRLALAYDPHLTNPERYPFSFVAQRWFECLTAGCVVIGRRPNCPETNQLINWEDATIEVPDSPEDLIPFVEDLLADQERLNAAHQRNYIHSLTSHDWRYRVATMLDTLGVAHPPSLQQALNDLAVAREQVKLSD